MNVKKFALYLSIVWAILAATLFGLAVGKVISLERFQAFFVPGFIIWVVLITFATQAMSKSSNDTCEIPEDKTDDQ